MATEDQTFEQWLCGAKVARERLSDSQRGVLEAAFRFLQQSGRDYSSCRIVSHFLMHCDLGLQVTQVARLVGMHPRTAFRHRNLSAKEVVGQIQQHFSGRPYGKLLPRHAGSIAEFLFTHPEATRSELQGFITRVWGFRVSKVSLWEFLKKYGLDRASLMESRAACSRPEAEPQPATVELVDAPVSGALVPVVPEKFFVA